MKSKLISESHLQVTVFHSTPSFVQDFTVSTVPVCGGARLKNICSMGGPDTIIMSSTDGARKTLRVSVYTCSKCVCVTFSVTEIFTASTWQCSLDFRLS